MDTTRDIISRLPELPLEPFEVAGVLGRSDHGPYLTIKPHSRPAPEPPVAPPSAAPDKSSFLTRKYFTQVIYPRVICYKPEALLDGSTLIDQAPDNGLSQTQLDMAALARKERFYKLSTFNAEKLSHPYWCSVKYGPWLAIAAERESCFDGVPNFWELFIVEVPEVALTWNGEWEDMPPYPSLQVIMGNKVLAGQQRACCPGFKWCATTQSCIPFDVDCQEPVPV